MLTSFTNVKDLSEERCRALVDAWETPKFASLCFFRLFSIPHLDAILLPRDTPTTTVGEVVRRFARRISSDLLMWRSDLRREQRFYPQGGVTLPLPLLLEKLPALFAQGRDIIILEPLNRFVHKATFSVAMTASELIVECLGPGYDGSDLQRGHVTPELVLRLPITGASFNPRDLVKTTVTGVAMEQRVGQRLKNLGHNIITPSIFERSIGEGDEDYARRFLMSAGYTKVLAARPMTLGRSNVHNLLNAASIIYAEFILARQWRTLSFSFTDTQERGPVFWDVFNAEEKYAIEKCVE